VTLSNVRDRIVIESAWERARRYADEILEKVQAADSVRVIGADPAILAPH
jgi:hypothetical protein